MERAVRVAVALMVSSGVACGLLYQPDDLSRDYGKAEATDGTTGPDGTIPGRDGAGDDTGTVTDGGGDAGRFCPQGDALLCDDFDDPPPATLGSRWSRVPTVNPDAGTFAMAIEGKSPKSPPSWLFVRAATNRISDTEGPHLQFDDPRKTGHLEIAFTMRIDSLDPAAKGRLVEYQAGIERLSLGCANGMLRIEYVDGTGQPNVYPVDETDFVGKPLDVVLDLQFDKNLFTLAIGPNVKVTQNPPALADTAKPVVRLGIPVFVSVQPIAVRYDNVVIR